MKVLCLPSLPSPENFKVRLFLDAAKVDYVTSHASLRVWADNRPRKDVRRRDGDINGRMIDSSKGWLETCVRKAFGYGYAIDPEKHQGRAVEKYQWHSRHPKVVWCPTKRKHGCFYSELLYGQEWRIAIFKGKTQRFKVFTFTVRELDADGLGMPMRVDGSSVYNVPDGDVLSPKVELNALWNLCDLLGLDYGEFDVIRHLDGRFCPIDVNPSPSPPSPHSFTPQDFTRIIPVESELFDRTFLRK